MDFGPKIAKRLLKIQYFVKLVIEHCIDNTMMQSTLQQ